jgi:hypothetical protein
VAGGAGDDDRHVDVLLRCCVSVTSAGRIDARLTSSNRKTSVSLPVGE